MKHTNQGCIYLLRNTVNGKCYVGQSVHNPPTQRIAQHLGNGFYYGEKGVKYPTLDSNRNLLIKADVDEYGKEAFEWKALRENVADSDLDEFEVEEMARYDALRPNGYNSNKGVNRKLIDKYHPKLIPHFVANPHSQNWKYDEERELWWIWDKSRETWFVILQAPKGNDNE